MTSLLWLALIGSIIGIAVWFWKLRERMRERQRASEERFAAMMAQVKPAQVTPPVADTSIPQQRLLLEAASKAAEAGEPVLSIQLYARLLARYPDTQFAAQARAAVEGQKKKLANAKA
ncbi:MAG TPA: hypothetical protein VD965_09755 [Burkholderiales bacterium]|nr:hypothetical protein [Burkholderiales bacterium]